MSGWRIATIMLTVAGVAVSSQAGTVNLSVGGEVTELETTHCRTDPYQSGQLQVEAELTAVGTFRGRPAALLVSKVSGGDADHIDLHLIELATELRTVSPLAASGQLLNDYSSELGRRQRDIAQGPDPEELAKLPPEEMMAKMDAAMEEQQRQIDIATAETDAIFAYLRSFGVITVTGSTIGFEGTDTRVIRGEQEPEFANVAGAAITVTAPCEN
jgi:hypothetical protein